MALTYVSEAPLEIYAGVKRDDLNGESSYTVYFQVSLRAAWAGSFGYSGAAAFELGAFRIGGTDDHFRYRTNRK